MHPRKRPPYPLVKLISTYCVTQSVYADIALSLGAYLQNRYWPQMKSRGVVVSEMVIEKALIATPRGPQLLRTAVDLIGNTNSAKCCFLTVDVRFSMLVVPQIECH